MPPAPIAISWPRLLAALLFAILVAGPLFVFWLYVFNTFFGFARTTSREGTQLLTTLAMQLAPAVIVLVSSFLPAFFAIALGPALIASLIARLLGLRSAPGLVVLGAMAGIAALLLFQFVDVAMLGARRPVLSLQDCALPAMLAGACGGLAAWYVALGWRPASEP